MKNIIFVLAILISTIRLPAQTNTPARLALIAESAEAAAAADVLTAELSSRKNLQLLERNEIEKVYREQGLSAGNKDYLKLGQVLGADGLLLLETAKEGTNQFLNVRLVAVKPGVVLIAEKFSRPMTHVTEWSPTFAKHLDLFLPKLTVLVKDAIPLSVVNLRSATASVDALKTERQLKLLAIQRLSREPQCFVLERQRMQLMTFEKDLKLDDSAFWNGSYLLDGVVDQNGYSPSTITIDARLTPPKGGAPIQFAVSGSRTNLADIVNQLAAKVNEALRVSSSAKEWNAADEAAKYFDEAKWALGWGVWNEAQAAADSAWALGKRDLDCATVRVKAYLNELSSGADAFHNSNWTDGTRDLSMEPQIIKEISAHLAATYRREIVRQNGKPAAAYHIVFVDKAPDPHCVDLAHHALELYYEFSKTLPGAEPKILSRGVGWNDGHSSDWYRLGIDCLVAASRILQQFNFVPESQKPVAEKLAELRELARSVAGLISKSPSVHDSYFVGDRIAVYDELANTIGEDGGRNPNIFSCEAQWGCFWQERPEDGLALYRELMSSPVFCYVHRHFWLRELQQPRLVGWNASDRDRLSTVWADFTRELDASTNLLLRLEAAALATADATDDLQAVTAFEHLFSLIDSNREELVANKVDLIYDGWGIGSLTRTMKGGTLSETQEALEQRFYSELRPKLEALDREYRDKTVPAQKTSSTFEMQKQYLKENTPYDFFEYVKTFQEKNYSKAQALEIQPLVAAYKSNLVAQSQNASGMQKGRLMGAIGQVGFLQNDVNRVLNPPAPPAIPAQPAPPAPVADPQRTKPVIAPNNTAEIVTNVLTVTKFMKVPLQSLYPLEGDEQVESSSAKITAHHWQRGKLLLNLQYDVAIVLRDGKGGYLNIRKESGSAIAIFDSLAEHWEVIGCPEVNFEIQNRFYHHTTLWRGEVFTSDGGQIKKYDSAKSAWQVLAIPDVGNCELFTVDNHLYAATPGLIVEILDGGIRTHILASNRRQPPACVLDTENLGTPALFAGPGQSLRIAGGAKIFERNGDDWRAVCAAPQAPLTPVVSDDGVLFLADGWNSPTAGIWRLATESHEVEFCLGQKKPSGIIRPNSSAQKELELPALWKLPPDSSLARMPAAVRGSDLYLLADHAKAQDIVDEKQHVITGRKVLPQNGYHAELLCFDTNFPAPSKVFLKFDDVEVPLPVTGDQQPGDFMRPGLPAGWLCFGGNQLFCGLEFPDHLPGGGFRTGPPRLGVWMISLSELDPAIGAQKNELMGQQQKTATQANADKKVDAQRRKAFLEKFDRNRNSTIDPDEQDAAMDDPYFIKYRLEQIHAQKRQ